MEPTYLSWSQSGFYQESIRSLPEVHTLYQESIRSPPGVHQEYQDFIRTPDGVHQDAWGSVTYILDFNCVPTSPLYKADPKTGGNWAKSPEKIMFFPPNGKSNWFVALAN